MRMRDPTFDLNEFEAEARIIFDDVYRLWKINDIETLEDLCSEEGLGFF